MRLFVCLARTTRKKVTGWLNELIDEQSPRCQCKVKVCICARLWAVHSNSGAFHCIWHRRCKLDTPCDHEPCKHSQQQPKWEVGQPWQSILSEVSLPVLDLSPSEYARTTYTKIHWKLAKQHCSMFVITRFYSRTEKLCIVGQIRPFSIFLKSLKQFLNEFYWTSHMDLLVHEPAIPILRSHISCVHTFLRWNIVLVQLQISKFGASLNTTL